MNVNECNTQYIWMHGNIRIWMYAIWVNVCNIDEWMVMYAICMIECECMQYGWINMNVCNMYKWIRMFAIWMNEWECMQYVRMNVNGSPKRLHRLD